MQTCGKGYFPDMLHLLHLSVPPIDSGMAITSVSVLVTQLFSLKIVSNVMPVRYFLRCSKKGTLRLLRHTILFSRAKN